MAFEEEGTSVSTYPTFAELNEILAGKFDIKMSVLEYGMPTFVVQWAEGYAPDNKEQEAVFNEITESTKSLKVWPLVRWRNEKEGEYIIRFVPKQRRNSLFRAGSIATTGRMFFPRGRKLSDTSRCRSKPHAVARTYGTAGMRNTPRAIFTRFGVGRTARWNALSTACSCLYRSVPLHGAVSL